MQADTTPNKAGGGIRLHGEKPCDRCLGFAGWTYNTAGAGTVTGAFAGLNITPGAACRNRAGIRGAKSFTMLSNLSVEQGLRSNNRRVSAASCPTRFQRLIQVSCVV